MSLTTQPNDILNHIFTFLLTEDILNVEYTSKRFHKVSRNNNKIRDAYNDYKIAQKILNKNEKIYKYTKQELLIKSITANQHVIDGMTDIYEEDIYEEYEYSDVKRFFDELEQENIDLMINIITKKKQNNSKFNRFIL